MEITTPIEFIGKSTLAILGAIALRDQILQFKKKTKTHQVIKSTLTVAYSSLQNHGKDLTLKLLLKE